MNNPKSKISKNTDSLDNPKNQDLAQRNEGSGDVDSERFGGPSKGGSGVPDDSKINQGLLNDDAEEGDDRLGFQKSNRADKVQK